jgi:hypothetical protein
MIKPKDYLIVMVCTFALSLPVMAGDNLGRLFSSPNERTNLDYLRKNQKLKVVVPTPNIEQDNVVKIAPPELPDPITLQGYVKRSDGKASTLWVNNQPVQENSTVDHVKIGKLNQRGYSKKGATLEGVEINIPANGKRVRLKAGQTYAPESNKIYERQVVEKARRLELEQSGVIDGGN